MDQPGGAAAEVRSAVADAHRREWAFVLAATARVAGDLDLAEECVQDAYLAALDAWTRQGVPDSPGAWLTTTARRRALDIRRRLRTLHDKLPLLIEPEPSTGALDDELGDDFGGTGAIPDDRLRLVFTCCHPALGVEAQIALTLRLVCGLTTRQIADAFLVSEATMAARVTRAKKKIAAARIPYRVPETNELPDRLRAVLAVVHLVYTTGHTDPVGTELTQRELAQRAIDLARMLLKLMPDEHEVRALLALLLLTDAREQSRTDAAGRLVLLEDQDRTRWNQDQIKEGALLVTEALRSSPNGRPGRYALQAAIAALHSEASTYQDTDWPQIVRLYGVLMHVWPSPVVALNRAVARAMVDGPEAGLAEIAALEHRLATDHDAALAGYRYLPAAKADLLRRLGRTEQAAESYREALALTEGAVERDFLQSRLDDLTAN